MRNRAIGTARAALLTASFVALGAGTAFPGSAFADTTDGDNSVLGGNQVSAPISAPINACGNSLALFGTADSACKGGAEVKNGGGSGGNETSGRSSVGGGNQVTAPISAPVNACGNAVAVFGSAQAGCEGGSTVKNGGSGGNRTSGRSSVGGGNQVTAPISAPVNVCGNAAAVFGDAVAACKGGAKVKNGGHGYGGGQQTSGKHSVLGGNQVTAPISAPVNVCGNAVGNAPASCEGGAAVKNSGFGGNYTSGKSSVGGGNQVTAPVGAPVNVCGNAAAVFGDAGAFCEGGAEVENGGSGGGSTSGESSVLGGNQVTAPVKAPVDVCGNAVAVLGEAAAGCQGSGGYGHGGHGGHDGHDGNGGHDGHDGYGSRSAQQAAGDPVAFGLPTMPGLTEALPLQSAGTLPGLPDLPVQPPVMLPQRAAAPATGTPVPADELPASGLQLPAGLPVQAPAALPVQAPAALPVQAPAALPVQAPAALPVQPGQLPVQPGQLPVRPKQVVKHLPVKTPARAADHSPVHPVDLPGSLPATPKLPAAAPAPAPVALPDLPELPVVSDVNLPTVSQAVRPVAASEPISRGLDSGMDSGSRYVLIVGALLAGASAAMAFTRRIRFGRR